MRRSPQLQQGEGAGVSNRPGNRAAAGPAALSVPRTPHHPKSGAALNDLVRSLDKNWRLGLEACGGQRSPAHSRTIADKTYSTIQRLFYSARPALDEIIERFNLSAPGFAYEKRLELLLGLLKSQTLTPSSRGGTPSGATNANPKNVPSTSRTARTADTFLFRRDDADSNYTTAPELGSPTDEDEPPQSPTPSSRSVPRRSQASPSTPARSNPRKRPSDSSSNAGTSLKLTRTSKGKQSMDMQPVTSAAPAKPEHSFVKPTREMMRSFQAAGTLTTSANTSFNASMSSSQRTRANTSFNTSASSSQQTPADTLNTSFTSFESEGEGQSFKTAGTTLKTTRTSSTTMGSLDDQDLIYVGTQLDNEILRSGALYAGIQSFLRSPAKAEPRSSNSTYGFIDESELAAASDEVTNGIFATPPRSIGSSRSPHKPSPAAAHAGSPRKIATAPTRQSPSLHLTEAAPPRMDRAISDQSPDPTKESPSKIAYYIRELPKENLFVAQLPNELSSHSFFVLFIACRISEATRIPTFDLMRGLDPLRAQNDREAFWSHIGRHSQMPKIALPEPKEVWKASKNSFEGFTFKGKLVFNSKSTSSKSVFKLELQPIQAEMSCQLQRQFGSDRFLYLTVPSFDTNKPERFAYEEMPQIREGFEAWLSETHCFLGRQWRVFHIQPVKHKGDSLKKDDVASLRLVLFAVEGSGIDRLPLGQMLNSFFPFEDNKEQSFCKAFARLDLGLSKTAPTHTFKPSQVRRIPDTFADGTAEESAFNDTKLSWTDPIVGRQVMNDGCSRMSVGAALLVWKCYREATGSDDPFPSVLQGRIGGAKGIWYISGEPQTRNVNDQDIWIEVTDSQLKFEPPWEDRADDRPYNKHRLTFNLLNYSHALRPAELHISFIPILVDRGVPKSVVAKQMIDRLHEQRQQLLEMLSNSVRLYNWISKQSSPADPANTRWQAALPQSLTDKLLLLLRSGLEPAQAPYLADALTRFLRQQQVTAEQKLRAPLGNATFMYGIADPVRVLRPGEVHIQFSTPFADEFTGSSYRNLNGLEVLLSRQPACRRSDIQKVRAVSVPELSHLVDVIVFPIQGEYPLAGKLQGGDYDGDIFWTCWEDCLVEPFRNAPAPMAPLNPAKYGITTDPRKLHNVMDPKDLSTIDNMLREAFKFRIAPSLLGKATVLLDKVTYHQNCISSAKTDALCDVHDLLVDAAKQAYSLTKNDWDNLVRYQLRCGNPGKPAYKKAMEDNAKAREEGNTVEETPRYKRENILDYLFFEVFHAHNVETTKQVSTRLAKEEDDDAVLRLPYLGLREGASDHLNEELDKLVASFAAIRNSWNSRLANKLAVGPEKYIENLQASYDPFRALLPSPQNASKPDIAALLEPYLGPSHPTTWDYIRASALYTTHPKKHSFVWHMAGRELARLKARSLQGTHDVVAPIFANLKPKPIKPPKPEEEDDELPDEDFESAMEQLGG